MFFTRRSELNDYLIAGVVASLVLHVLLGTLMARPKPNFAQAPLVIDLVPPPEILRSAAKEARQQIVSPPDTSESKPPPETRLLSERDSSTPKEQLKRGHDLDAGIPGVPSSPPADRPAPERQPAESRQAERPGPRTPSSISQSPAQPKSEQPESGSKPEQHAAVKGTGATRPLKQLLLDDKTLLREFGGGAPSTSRATGTSRGGAEPKVADISPPPSYHAFSRPFGTGARFLGQTGTADHIPNLPDGDITLLNTKADRFAVFVRRVATQVFAQLRASGWDGLRAGDIQAIRDYSTVRATLSPKGDLLQVEVLGRSGSGRFDDVLLQSVRAGARDPHPPANAAAEDGNIHFIFKSKSWTRVVPGAHGGASERRWLLLATGLE